MRLCIGRLALQPPPVHGMCPCKAKLLQMVFLLAVEECVPLWLTCSGAFTTHLQAEAYRRLSRANEHLSHISRHPQRSHEGAMRYSCASVFSAVFWKTGLPLLVPWQRLWGGGDSALERQLSNKEKSARKRTQSFAVEDNKAPRSHRISRSRVGSCKSADACYMKRTVDGADRPVYGPTWLIGRKQYRCFAAPPSAALNFLAG